MVMLRLRAVTSEESISSQQYPSCYTIFPYACHTEARTCRLEVARRTVLTGDEFLIQPYESRSSELEFRSLPWIKVDNLLWLQYRNRIDFSDECKVSSLIRKHRRNEKNSGQTGHTEKNKTIYHLISFTSMDSGIVKFRIGFSGSAFTCGLL